MLNRREFAQSSAGALAAGLSLGVLSNYYRSEKTLTVCLDLPKGASQLLF